MEYCDTQLTCVTYLHHGRIKLEIYLYIHVSLGKGGIHRSIFNIPLWNRKLLIPWACECCPGCFRDS